jgi:hypothetical protein
MQEKSTPSTGAGPHNLSVPVEDSPTATILIATFFLSVPFVMLLIIAWRGHRTPSEDYLRAVRESARPELSHVSHRLVSVPLDEPTSVVTWTRRSQVSNYEGETTPQDRDTWVTVVPFLKNFCRDYVKLRHADPMQLTLRLKQRLGLPLVSNYDTFVELAVDPKDLSKFFRPCGDPSPDTNTCQPASPPKPTDIDNDLGAANNKDKNGQPKESKEKKMQGIQSWYWFLDKYYTSFATESPYPWTSLGYTFDWAPKEDGSEEFVRWGESEFVIAPGTPIQFRSATDTVAYCSPQ